MKWEIFSDAGKSKIHQAVKIAIVFNKNGTTFVENFAHIFSSFLLLLLFLMTQNFETFLAFVVRIVIAKERKGGNLNKTTALRLSKLSLWKRNICFIANRGLCLQEQILYYYFITKHLTNYIKVLNYFRRLGDTSWKVP